MKLLLISVYNNGCPVCRLRFSPLPVPPQDAVQQACSITVQILSPPHATESVYEVRMLVLTRGRGRMRVWTE